MSWLETGDSVEVRRFCKFFEIWKTVNDHPVRIILVAALLESSVSSMIPESLAKSFSDGMENPVAS